LAQRTFFPLGDLKKGDKILEWLISQKDPGRDKIEEVDETTLRRILEVHEHCAVYFCKLITDTSLALIYIPLPMKIKESTALKLVKQT